MKGRIRLLCALAFGAISVAPIPAQAQLYLHSDSEEKLTAELATKLDEAEKQYIASLDAHKIYLEDKLEKERQLIVQRSLALRDGYLVAVLNEPTGAAQKKALQTYIDWAWVDTFGQPRSEPVENSYQQMIEDIDRFESELARLKAAFVKTLADSLDKPLGFEKYCNPAVNQGFVAGAVEGFKDDDPEVDQVAIIADLKSQCEGRIRGAVVRLEKRKKPSDPLLAALLGDSDASRYGEIGVAKSEIARINLAIETQKSITTALGKKVRDLEKYAKCEAEQTGGAERIAEFAGELNSLIDRLANTEAGTFLGTKEGAGKPENGPTIAEAWRKLNAIGEPPVCNMGADASPETNVKPGNGADAEKLDLDAVMAAIEDLDKYALNDALTGAVKAAALDIQGGALSDILSGLASAPSDSEGNDVSKKQLIARSLLRSIGHLEQFSAAQSGELPDTAGILVALAEVRMHQKIAQIEADRLGELKKYAEMRLTAVRQRGLQLIQAQYSLDRYAPQNPARLDEAILRYGASWDQGAIPAILAQEEMRNGRFLPWLARERAVVEATFGVLRPAVSQLEIYGAGGIEPSLIAQILQVIGINAIAVK